MAAGLLNGILVPLSGDKLIDAMTSGYKWQLGLDRNIDWSISDGWRREFWNNPTEVVAKFSQALSIMSYYANIKFTYTGYFLNPGDANLSGSDINLALDSGSVFGSSTNIWAIGYFPNPNDNNRGDIYVNINSSANSISYELGSAGWFLILHEIGHTLGLKHPHDDGGTGRPTFSQLGWSSLDIDLMTMMSYEDDYDFNLTAFDPATPMILDVLALQYLYGKNMLTNAGDSRFILTNTNFYATLWDASGSDVIDQSGASEGWYIVLPDIYLSSLVDTKAGYAIPMASVNLTSPTSLYWLAGDFENVIGSAYSDHIYLNSMNNVVDGGGGLDTVFLNASRSQCTITFSSGQCIITSLDGGTDILSNVEYVGFSDGIVPVTNLSTADTTAPTVSTFTPADGTTGVAVGNNIVLTFSEAIARGTGTITVRSGSATGAIVESFDAATSNRISISGSTLTIDPTNNLAGNTRYFVVFSSGNVRDLAGNAYAGTSTYDFTTARTATTDDFPNTAATTGVVTIGGAATTGSIETARDVDLFRVSLTAGVTYTFNLNATSGSIDPVLVLRNSTLEQLAENDDYGSSRNSQITFTASSSGTYYLQAGGFTSSTGTYSIRGMAVDTTAPTVSAFTPADGATAVAVGANIVLTFSENIAKGTGTITLRSGSATGAIVENFDAASSNRLTVSGSTLTIDPTSDLSANTQYFVVFTSGNIKDTAGNAYAGTSTYDFRTAAADTTAPTVTSFSPTDAATGVAVGNNIVLTFSEAIARGTGTITVRSGSASGAIVESFDAATSNRISISGSTLTIDPTNNLAGNTRYFVVFSSGNVRDLAGNAFKGTSTYDFTTGSAPTTTSDDYSSTTGTTGVVTIGGAATTGSIETTGDVDAFRVSLTAGVTYTFNLNATSGSLDPYLSLVDSNGTRLAYNDDFGSSRNSQITFTATSSGTYYLGAQGFTGTGAYSIRGTAQANDTIAPTVSTFSPADGTTGVAVGNNIVLTFSEAIARGTGTITVRSGSATGTIVESFDAATSNRISISGSTLTIDPTNNLAGNTRYFVVFSSGNVRDLAGNAYAGTSTYDFTTVGSATDTIAPTVSTFTPADAATGVAVGNNIVLTFSEAIARGTGTITVRSGSATGTIVESFDAATSNRISISGSTLTIDSTNDLAGNTRYFVVFSSGNVRDLAGNAYRGTSTYDFTTGSAPTTTSDDYTNTTATTGRVFTGYSPATGTIEVAGDIDAFRVYLTAGATYTFNLDATSGSLNPYLGLYDSNLTRLAYNDDFGSSRNAQITFTATSSGAYYLGAQGLSGTGAYSLRATTTAADDYANNTATTGVVAIGGAATTGRINYADDADLFRVSLTAGVTYTFNLNATSGSYNPYLSLYDSNGTRLAYNDDFGSSLNSQITFTATSSGTYYVQASSVGADDTGTYSLQGRAQATDTIAPTVSTFSPTDAATGVAVGNNIVLTFSEAVARGTGTITIRSGSATGTIVESFDAATSNRISISGSTLTIDPTNNLAGNTRYFVVFSSGNVRDLAGNAYAGTSTYDFTTGSAPTTTSDDYTNTAATTGRVFAGSGPATGTIEVAGDVDAFRVYLTAGATYTFNLNATSGSLDPVLSLYNSNLTLLTFNDDFGSSRNSQITFTATSSGVYYLGAEGLTGTGAYSLRATTTAADDYPFNTAGVVTIGGGATTGTINYADDADLFRVSLTAGVTYTFNLNATSGPYNPYLSLLDSNGTQLAYNDDFGSSLNSQITFTATSSGTYYLAAFSFGTDTGTYSLQGRVGSTSAIAQSALSVAPVDSVGRSDGMAPETDLAMIPPSKSNEPGNQIGVIEAEILLALANSNDPFANEHLALQNFSVNQGAHPQSILLEHSPHTTHYSVADTFHFGSEDVLEHFRNDDVALTRTEFNAVIFDPAHHWTANSAFDPAIYNGDEFIFDVTEFGSLSTANGYHQVDFIL